MLKSELIKPLGLNVTQAAVLLKVGRVAMSNVLNGKASLSLEMCLKLSIVFGVDAEDWYNRQIDYDLQKAFKKVARLGLERYVRSPNSDI
jgi:addiction module HigA family antidote